MLLQIHSAQASHEEQKNINLSLAKTNKERRPEREKDPRKTEEDFNP